MRCGHGLRWLPSAGGEIRREGVVPVITRRDLAVERRTRDDAQPPALIVKSLNRLSQLESDGLLLRARLAIGVADVGLQQPLPLRSRVADQHLELQIAGRLCASTALNSNALPRARILAARAVLAQPRLAFLQPLRGRVDLHPALQHRRHERQSLLLSTRLRREVVARLQQDDVHRVVVRGSPFESIRGLLARSKRSRHAILLHADVGHDLHDVGSRLAHLESRAALGISLDDALLSADEICARRRQLIDSLDVADISGFGAVLVDRRVECVDHVADCALRQRRVHRLPSHRRATSARARRPIFVRRCMLLVLRRVGEN